MQSASLEAPSASVDATPPRQRSVGDSVTHGALALLSTQPLTWAGSLLTTVVVPSLLGADALGQLTIVVTIATMAATATSLGISEYLVRRIAQQPATLRQDLGVALLLQTIATLVGAVTIVLLAPLGIFPVRDQTLLVIAVLGMLIVPGQTVLLSAFRGRELHTQYAWFNAATMVLGQVLGILVLYAGAGVLGYMAVAGLSILAVTAISWKLSGVRPTLPSLDRALLSQMREFVVGGFPFWTWGLALTITSGIDRVILGVFVPIEEVGWYAAAYRVFAIPVFIPTLIVTPLFPALSRMAHEPEIIRKTITKTMRLVLLMMVPLCAGTMVVAPIIPKVLGWPSDFDNASPLIAILSLQLPIVAVDMLLGVVLMAIGRQGAWVVVGIVATVLKIAMDYAAIPTFENLYANGAIGASAVTLVSELIMFLGALILLPKQMLDPRIAWDAARILTAGAATYVVGSALLPTAPVAGVVGGAAAYVVVTILLRVMSMADARALGQRVLVRARHAR